MPAEGRTLTSGVLRLSGWQLVGNWVASAGEFAHAAPSAITASVRDCARGRAAVPDSASDNFIRTRLCQQEPCLRACGGTERRPRVETSSRPVTLCARLRTRPA